MSGRHSIQKSKKKIVPVIIVIAVLITVAAIVCVFVIMSNSSSDIRSDSSLGTTTVNLENSNQTDAQTIPETTREQGFTSAETSEVEDIIVPTISGEEQGACFTAAFTPYKAVDPDTDTECSLKVVFGSAYAGGSISFSDDGTFYDSVGLTGAVQGAFAVEGDSIVATYSNDKNMLFTITQYDDSKPSEISVNYGGYDIYFK